MVGGARTHVDEIAVARRPGSLQPDDPHGSVSSRDEGIKSNGSALNSADQNYSQSEAPP
jgi:hypothetical protein